MYLSSYDTGERGIYIYLFLILPSSFLRCMSVSACYNKSNRHNGIPVSVGEAHRTVWCASPFKFRKGDGDEIEMARETEMVREYTSCIWSC